MFHVPIVIIANKQDLPNAMKPSDLIQKLSMNELGAKHKWFVQSACAVTGDGLIEAMLEMGNLVKQHRKENDY
jgi:signal recognition particle receptor subunit beta